ncbi:hypothetical protein [Acidithiobacillus concretivorus]|uniref:HEPN domain-containing protein n=1 Tax=Acidithiobacillus concretivorus TaxID=3063952 RepID=A0ABS5ZTS0_9PROT|nr:hypothetical protein [Acidithiobacillus concretivorus]MBU2739902.1 hypothetical protein [Acidithiobacillus concretivorus]
MPVNPSDFIEFAKNLACPDEISRRTSISRAYYGCYHFSEILCAQKGIDLSTGSSSGGIHKRLCAAMQGSQDANMRSLGDKLDRLRKKRIRADYDLADQVGAKETAKIVCKCERLLVELKKNSP